MPAQATGDEQYAVFLHVYNRGVADSNIFRDDEDFSTFLNFIESYLTPRPADAETKTTFKIGDKEYTGKPHLPNNHHDKIELVAYSLLPNHFHLVLREIEPNGLQSFARSLGTKYSMYFNKKHNRRGPLFEGTYKSEEIVNPDDLINIVTYLHKHPNKHDLPITSSLLAYLDATQLPWVKSNYILDRFTDADSNEPNLQNYVSFLDNYSPSVADLDALGDILLENDKDIAVTTSDPQSTEAVLKENFANLVQESAPVEERKLNLSTLLRPDVILVAVVFIVLFTFGLLNVRNNQIAQQEDQPNNTAQTLSEQPQSPENLEPGNVEGANDDRSQYSGPKVQVVAGIPIVNIRQSPSTQASVVTSATSGDTYELISLAPDWCGIRLTNGQVAYIATQFIELVGEVAQ